jgi:hypothetical protein
MKVGMVVAEAHNLPVCRFPLPFADEAILVGPRFKHACPAPGTSNKTQPVCGDVSAFLLRR